MIEDHRIFSETQSPLDVDIRTSLMHEIFDKYPSGDLMIFKSFRVGVTTSSCIASIDRHEKLLIVEVTNEIGNSTIVKDILKKRPNARIVSVKANRFCTKNIRLSNQYPDLKKLKMMILPPGCGEECEDYRNCEVMQILRDGDADIIVITVDKLVALMLSSGITKNSKKDNENEEPGTASKILSKLFSVKTVIFDEAHWMQNPAPVSTTIAVKKGQKIEHMNKFAKYERVLRDFYISLESIEKPGKKNEVFVDYSPICDEYMSNEMMARVTLNFAALLSGDEITEARDALIEELNEPKYQEKHFGKMRNNPQYSWRTQRDMSACVSRICEEAIQMIIKEEHKSKYKLIVEDLNDLFDMASIVTADMIQVNAVRVNENFNINMSVANRIKFRMVAHFIRLFKEPGDKRVILTTATFGSFNYDSILPIGEKFERIMFGENGDPLNTNEKMLILADTKRLSFTKGRYSALQQMPEITKNIINILNEFGDCFIIAPNKMLADLFQKSLAADGYNVDVTYYKSDKTIGIKSDCRVAVVICAAETPANSCDTLTTNPEESMRMRQDNVEIDTAQAINRVKDPNGFNPSVVFMFGVTEEQANNIATWGMDRKVSVINNGKGKRKELEVTCSRYIAKPKVLRCDDFAIALSTAKKHMGSDKSPEVTAFDQRTTIGQKSLLPTSENEKIGILNNILTIKSQSQLPTDTRNGNIYIGSCDCTKVSHVDFLNLILKHGLVGNSDSLQLSESIIKRHLDGKNILKTQIVVKDGKVGWVLFRDIKFARDVERITKYLSSFTCPYVIEQDLKSQTYGVWVFIEPIEAKKAKKFGEYIIKGIEKSDAREFHCELIPKYTNHKSGKFKDNNEIKLPIHPNSKILVNNEFVNTFESLEVGVLDIATIVAKIDAHEALTAEGKMVAEGVKDDTELKKQMGDNDSYKTNS